MSRNRRAGAPPPSSAPADRITELDARLALATAVAWLVQALGHNSSGHAVLVLAVTAALVGLGCVGLSMWLRPAAVSGKDQPGPTALRTDPPPSRRPTAHAVTSTLGLAALCTTIVLLPLSAALTRVQSGPVHALTKAQANGAFEVVTTADARPLGGQAFGGTRFALDAQLRRVRSGAQSFAVNVPVVVLGTGADWSAVGPGQRIRLDGRMASATGSALVAATISARGSPILIGRTSALQRLATRVRSALRTACAGLPQPERGLLPGLVDGDTSGLDQQLKQNFRTAGLTHLVAVSGTNAAIVIGVVLLLLRRARVPPWCAAVIGAVCLVLFVVVARPSPSVLRAAVMAAVLQLSLATGRPRQGLPALAFAVLVLLGWHPDWSRNAGFAMSVLATGALLVVAPGWTDALRRRHVPAGIAEGLAVSAAATAVSAPIIVVISGQVSLVSLPANLLAEVAVAPATVLGVLAAATAPWSPPLGAALAYAASFPCRWLAGVGTFFGSLAGATISWPQTRTGALVLALLIGAVVALARLHRLRLPLLVAALTALVVQVPVRSMTSGWPAPGTIFVVCDVGQGDAVVLPMGHHAGVVVDSGPEPVAIDRCLRSLGITTVAVYLQSHYHLDHVGGIDGLVRGRHLGRVYVGPLQTPVQGHQLLLHALGALGVTPTVVAVNTTIDAGPVHLQVIASHVVTVDSVGDPNESSLVIRATVQGHTVLLTGDASTLAQQDLLASGEPITAEILKVPHHGSAYFSPPFMAAVHARLAIISVGAHNPYGHPALRLLDDLRALGMSVRRTDEDGDVAVVATATGLGVQRHKTGPSRAAGSVLSPVQRRTPVLSARVSMRAWWLPRSVPATPATAPWPAGWCSSSATRSSSSVERSSRSPPTGVASIRTPRWSTGSVPNWSPPSCTRCSAHRCSGEAARSSSATPRTC